MTDEANAVQLGKLLLAGKIGELLPREKGGRGKKTPIPPIGVSNASTQRYRKIHDHSKRIEEYSEKAAGALCAAGSP